MTFESIVNAKENNNVNEVVGIKVSFGNEIRRVSFNGTTYTPLAELVAKLFSIDQASVVLKYEDEDGDKVTLSTDGELQDAIQYVKAKKTLRLFVETRVVKGEANSTPPRCPAVEGGVHPFHHRGFHGHRGGPHWHRGFHAPHFQPAPEGEAANQAPVPPAPSTEEAPAAAFHHPYARFGHGRFSGPHRGHGPHGPFGAHGPHGHHGHHGPFGAHGPHGQGPLGRFGEPVARYGSPCLFSHGTFSPADSASAEPVPAPQPSEGEEGKEWEGKFRDFRMKKRAMKETISAMKASATTPEDFEAIRELKQSMKADCKSWKGHRHHQHQHHSRCNKDERFSAKHVTDVTIPDNSELPADTPVTKTWRLRNSGEVAWPANSQLIFVSRRGDNLNGPERVKVGGGEGEQIQPQQEVEVSVTFITPSEPGRYIGYYRMATAEGAKFGQRVWVSFIIPSAQTGASSSTTSSSTTTTTFASDVVMG